MKIAGKVLVCAAVGVAGAMVSGCNRGDADEFETETLFRGEKTNLGWDNSVTAEFPVSGGSALLDSVRTWLDRELKEYIGMLEECAPYGGALDDGRAMVDYYSEELLRLTSEESDKSSNEGVGQQGDGKDAPLNGDGSSPDTVSFAGETHLWITVFCSSNKFVTYESSYNLYTGGAHGSHGWTYATFRRNNGQLLGWDIFKNDALEEVCTLIESALDTDYFTKEYDEPYFANGGTTWDGQLRLPQGLPGFVEDGIIFQYAEYEIVPYSFGSPFCLIPYANLRPYMTKSALQLIK